MKVRVAARSKAWTVFARSNTGIAGSNPTRGMDVCVRLFRICVVLCVGSGLATGWSPVQGVLPTVYRLRNWKAAKVHKGCRARGGMLLVVQDTRQNVSICLPTYLEAGSSGSIVTRLLGYGLDRRRSRPVLSPTPMSNKGSLSGGVTLSFRIHFVMKGKKDWSYTSTRRPRLVVGRSAVPLQSYILVEAVP
jgi:hypothetical protein